MDVHATSEAIDASGSPTGVAYGLRIAGFRDPALAGRGSTDLPLVEVIQRIGDHRQPRRWIGADRAEVGDSLVIDRIRGTVTVHTDVVLPTYELVHPTLAWVGAVFAHWRGFLAMHGGAFVASGGAWMVLADKGGGKSSTLAALHLAGLEVLADDLIVVGDGIVFPGPRCVDVKEDPGALLGEDVPYTRHGARRRILLPTSAGPVPLAGAVLFEWGDGLHADRLSAADRLVRLIPHCTLRETDPRVLLGLAGVPTWVVTRPRSVQCLPDVVECLADLVGESRA